MGTPYLIGWNESAASTATLVISAGSNGGSGTSAGDAIVVQAGNSSGTQVTGVADSQGNTYREVTSTTTDENQSMWVADTSNNSGGTTALTAGTDTQTITYAAANTNVKTAVSGGVTGYSGTDVVPTPTDSASSTPASIASGTLAQASEVIWFGFQNGNGGGTPTVTGATALATGSGGSAEFVTLAAVVVTSTASVTGSAALTAASKWSALCFSLKAVASPVTGSGSVKADTPVLAAAGTVASPPVTGTGSVKAPAPVLAAAGTVGSSPVTGSGGVTAPTPALAASGSVTVPGSITVTVCGEGGFAAPVTGTQTAPGVQSAQVDVTNTDGDWMFALVTWRQLPTLGGTSVTVGDDVHNYWEPLGQPAGTSSPNGVVRTAIWYAPAAKAASFVMIAPTGVCLGIAATIVDVNGLPPWVSPIAIRTAFANSASSLSSMSPAPGAPTLIFTTFGNDGDLLAAQAGAGWNLLPSINFSNGVDTTSDISINSAWQVASSATSSWSAAGTADLAGATAGTFLTVAAPAQASPFWPVTITEIAPNAGPATPPDEITWVPLTPRSLALSMTQGRQYNLGTLQAGAGVLSLDNPDGAVMPPGSGAFAGIDSGTPVRTRQIWTGGAWQLQYTGNGATSGPQADTGNMFAVTPGVTYTVAAWLACSVPYDQGQTISIRWKNSGGGLISLTASEPVTGTVPVLATASGVAPAGAVQASVIIGAAGVPPVTTVFTAAASPSGPGYLVISPQVSWSAENFATVTTLGAWTPDVRGAPVISPYSVPAGVFMQKWPRQWNTDTYRGQTAATITDAWGYCNANLQPILQQEILNDLPYAYWPCTDSPGVAQASNVAAGNGNPLMVMQSKYGTAGTTQAFGTNSDALLGAQGTLELTSSVRDQSEAGMWQQVLPSTVTTTPIQAQGHSLTCTDSNFPPVADGVTFEVWFQVQAPYQFGGGSDFITESVLVVRNTVNVLFSVLVIGNGGSLGLIEGAGLGGAGNATIGISGVDYRAMSGLQHLAISTTRNTWTAYLNGAKTASGSWASTLNQQFSVVSVNGDITQVGGIAPSGATGLTGTYNCYSGFAGHIAVFPMILSPQRILTHYIAGQFGMAGDSVQERIERLLQAAPFLGRRVILQDSPEAVTAVASCQDIGGQAAAISIQNVGGSTPPAVLSVSPAGEIFYLARTAAWNQAPRWVLGDAPWLGEIPMKPGFGISYDPLRVVNDIQLTQLDNLDIVTPSGRAAPLEIPSQQQYGDQSYWQTGYLQGDLTEPVTFGPGLSDEANWIAATNARPVTRLDQVLVDAAGNPAAWQFVTQAAAGDMVTVNIRPPTSTEVITVTGRISQTQRSLQFSQDTMTGSVQCLIDAAPEQAVLTADDPVLGQLTGGHPLAW